MNSISAAAATNDPVIEQRQSGTEQCLEKILRVVYKALNEKNLARIHKKSSKPRNKIKLLNEFEPANASSLQLIRKEAELVFYIQADACAQQEDLKPGIYRLLDEVRARPSILEGPLNKIAFDLAASAKNYVMTVYQNPSQYNLRASFYV